MTRVDTVQNRRREPDELAIPEIAIQNHCRECMGFQPSLVEGCTAPACWLHPLRLGVPSKSGQKIANDIKAPARGDSDSSPSAGTVGTISP